MREPLVDQIGDLGRLSTGPLRFVRIAIAKLVIQKRQHIEAPRSSINELGVLSVKYERISRTGRMSNGALGIPVVLSCMLDEAAILGDKADAVQS